MIQIDRRRGSAEPCILDEFSTYGTPWCETTLASADFAFLGFGWGDKDSQNPPSAGDWGAIKMWGFERKTLMDFIDSLETKRLFPQLATMAGYENVPAAYDFPWLIVEGVWRADTAGFLQIPIGNRWGYPHNMRKFPVEKIENALMMITTGCGIRIQRTYDWRETVAFIVRTFRLFQKPWGDHQMIRGFSIVNLPNHAHFVEPSQVRMVASTFAGIGWEKSAAVEARFPSVKAFIDAAATDPANLLEVDGIGKTISQNIHRAVILDNYKR